MSAVNYSKWDNIELSDDEDQEVHPNIDRASWIRLMQQKIHKERAERKQKIAQLKAEHSTNEGLRQRLVKLEKSLKDAADTKKKHEILEKLLKEIEVFDRERKEMLLNPEHEQFMQVKDVDEVFTMLMSRLVTEAKLSERNPEKMLAALPGIFEVEYPKLDKRQNEVLDSIAKEEKEQSKKLTSDNISKEGFSTTRINSSEKKTLAEAASANSPTSSDPAKGKQKKAPTTTKEVEVLNPGYEKNTQPKQMPDAERDEFNLPELTLGEEKILLEFADQESFESSFRILQKYPQLVTREYSDHLMARAFKLQMRNRGPEAKKCVKWALALNYSMQLGSSGVGMFYKRMMSGVKEAIQYFDDDLNRTYAHLQERSKVLAQKTKQESQWSEENSNLTPEQATAFNSFPKHFQLALASNDMGKINESFAKMSEQQSKEIMDLCQKTGLITVLSEEESKKLMQEQEQQGQKDVK